MHTHFHPATGRWFSVRDCETCGRPIQEPNALTAHETETRMRQFGMVIVDELPPQGWWDDEVGGEVCERPDCKS